jgi:hypothetical protein
MFGDAAVHSFPPEAKTRRLQLTAHDGYDFPLHEASALLDFLKARSVLPSQPHDPGNLLRQKDGLHVTSGTKDWCVFGLERTSSNTPYDAPP